MTSPRYANAALAGGGAAGKIDKAGFRHPSNSARRPANQVFVDVNLDLDFLFAHLKENPVGHKRLDAWRASLLQRLWQQRALLHRTGMVGVDWELLLDELEEFGFVAESMRAELARKSAS
jgi:hypothetical protein